MKIYKYRYQKIVGGVTWQDIEDKVTPQEMMFVLTMDNLEKEIADGKQEL